MPITSAFGKLRQGHEFKTCLGYTVSSRPAVSIYRETLVSTEPKQNKTQQNKNKPNNNNNNKKNPQPIKLTKTDYTNI